MVQMYTNDLSIIKVPTKSNASCLTTFLHIIITVQNNSQALFGTARGKRNCFNSFVFLHHLYKFIPFPTENKDGCIALKSYLIITKVTYDKIALFHDVFVVYLYVKDRSIKPIAITSRLQVRYILSKPVQYLQSISVEKVRENGDLIRTSSILYVTSKDQLLTFMPLITGLYKSLFVVE